MNFESVNITLLLSAVLIVPGFIINATVSMLIPQRTISDEMYKNRVVVFSAFNFAICSWLIFYLLFGNPSLLNKRPFWYVSFWCIIILVVPIFIGFIIGIIAQKEVQNKIFNAIGLSSVRSIPSAWDYHFFHLKNTAYVLLTLIDGSRIAGYFGKKSFASSSYEKKDIYLERTYIMDDDKKSSGPTDGIYINTGQIKTIEFWITEGTKNEEGK